MRSLIFILTSFSSPTRPLGITTPLTLMAGRMFEGGLRSRSVRRIKSLSHARPCVSLSPPYNQQKSEGSSGFSEKGEKWWQPPMLPSSRYPSMYSIASQSVQDSERGWKRVGVKEEVRL